MIEHYVLTNFTTQVLFGLTLATILMAGFSFYLVYTYGKRRGNPRLLFFIFFHPYSAILRMITMILFFVAYTRLLIEGQPFDSTTRALFRLANFAFILSELLNYLIALRTILDAEVRE